MLYFVIKMIILWTQAITFQKEYTIMRRMGIKGKYRIGVKKM